jgi:hypothetical protein
MVFPGIFALLTLFFAWLYYERYWKWRDCIEAAESSCVLPDGDNLTGGGMIWGVFAILFAIVTVVSWLFSRPRRQ